MLIIIDNILKLTPIRWGLLVMVTALTIFCLVQKGNIAITNMQLEAAEGRSAILSSSLSTQNVAIKKVGEDTEVLRQRLLTANKKATELRKQLENRKVEIREVVLQGDCPDMVQQVLDEVRR